jgi:hypothetical protein
MPWRPPCPDVDPAREIRFKRIGPIAELLSRGPLLRRQVCLSGLSRDFARLMTLTDRCGRSVLWVCRMSGKLTPLPIILLSGPALGTRRGQGRPSRPVEPDHVLVVEPPDAVADFGLGNRGDLVNHQRGRRAQPVALVRLHEKPKQGRVGRVRGEGADRDLIRSVEAVVLHYDDGARLASIVLAARDCPNLSTFHSSYQLDTASMNA